MASNKNLTALESAVLDTRENVAAAAGFVRSENGRIADNHEKATEALSVVAARVVARAYRLGMIVDGGSSETADFGTDTAVSARTAAKVFGWKSHTYVARMLRLGNAMAAGIADKDGDAEAKDAYEKIRANGQAAEFKILDAPDLSEVKAKDVLTAEATRVDNNKARAKAARDAAKAKTEADESAAKVAEEVADLSPLEEIRAMAVSIRSLIGEVEPDEIATVRAILAALDEQASGQFAA